MYIYIQYIHFALGPLYIFNVYTYILDIQCFKIKASHFIHLS